jgi:hypothetical protein
MIGLCLSMIISSIMPFCLLPIKRIKANGWEEMYVCTAESARPNRLVTPLHRGASCRPAVRHLFLLSCEGVVCALSRSWCPGTSVGTGWLVFWLATPEHPRRAGNTSIDPASRAKAIAMPVDPKIAACRRVVCAARPGPLRWQTASSQLWHLNRQDQRPARQDQSFETRSVQTYVSRRMPTARVCAAPKVLR